jgi:uncharacterized protein
MARPLALVTGASSGIGAEMARDLAQRGHDLILVARRAQAMEALAAQLRQAHGATCTVIAQDLAAPGGVAALVMQLQSLKLEPEVLINNAGLGNIGEHDTAPWADQVNMIDLNVRALTELTHALLPAMVKRRAGKILNVASTAAFQPGPGMAVYFASKAYVLSYSEALHQELKHKGISVSALCPGPTASEFVSVASKNRRISLADKVPFASASGVARYGIAALMRNQAVAVHGLPNRLGVWSIRFTPRFVVRRLIALVFKPV